MTGGRYMTRALCVSMMRRRWPRSCAMAVLTLIQLFTAAASASAPLQTLTTQCSELCRGVRPAAQICIPYASRPECLRHVHRTSDTCANNTQHAATLCMPLEETKWSIGLSNNKSMSELYFGGVIDYNLLLDQATVVLSAVDFETIDRAFAPMDATRTLALQSLGNVKTLQIPLTTAMLSRWSMLEQLSLRGLDLSSVDVLPLFPRLVDLDLTRTSLASFPFQKAPVLSTLTLSHNDLERLDLTVVPQNLRTLVLEDCNLKAMPIGIEHLANLDVLQLSGNNFAKLRGVPAWSQLSSLNMSNTQWSHFPANISRMASLKMLDLSRNPIGSISDQSLPPSLTQVSLAYCGLNTMPSDITRDNWTSIDLSGNLIPAADIEATKATTEHLKLANMGLTKTPNLVGTWKITGALDLSSNPIQTLQTSSIPATVSGLLADNCSLTAFPSNLKALTELKDLSLSHNRFESIAQGMLPTLQTLNLSFCGLKSVPADIASMSDELQELDLSGNSIAEFNLSLPNIEVLRMSGNGLTALPVLKTHLRELDLRGNSIHDVKLSKEEFSFLSGTVRLLIDADMFARCNGSAQFLLGVPVCVTGQDSSDTVSTGNTSTVTHKLIVVWPIICACLATAALVIAIAYMQLTRSRARAMTSATEDTAFSYGGNKTSSNSTMLSDRQGTSMWDDEELLKWRVDVQLIEPIEALASGAFGVVWSAKYLGETVVTKRLHQTLTKREMILKFIDEIRFMANFEHPKIVRFIGVAWTKESDIQMILEFMSNGDVWSYLQRNKHLKKRWTRQKLAIALDIAEALVYLHSLDPKVIHRDLKAKNILLDSNMTAKLGDFGVSRNEAIDETMTAGVGTSRWMAPEVLVGEAQYTEAVDIYSFGIVMLELDSHNLPFANARRPDGSKFKETALMDLLSRGEVRPPLSSSSPADLKRMLGDCMARAPNQRPTAVQIAYILRQTLQGIADEPEDAGIVSDQLAAVDPSANQLVL